MLYPGCLPLAVFFGSLILLPLFFAQLMVTALSKLGLDPQLALLTLLGIFFGGSINIPLRRIPREEEYMVDPFMLFGFGQIFPRLRLVRSTTTLAVNVGGCLIPLVIALYECLRVFARGPAAVLVLVIIAVLNVGVCYRLARPVRGVGITMPALIPPVMAAVPSLLLAPDFAPPIAFTAGVLGPLIGADLLHLRDVKHFATGMASIGGAGTFDGIVLSGLLAAFLA